MTTIAMRGGIVAADTQTTSRSDVRTGHLSKIRKLESGEIIGVLGKGVHAFPLSDWYEKGRNGPQPDHSDGCLVVFKPTGEVEIYEDGGYQPGGYDEFHAFGSGSEIATGAMMAGATAAQAVEIAIARDIYSGGRVEILHLDVTDAPVEAEEDDEEAEAQALAGFTPAWQPPAEDPLVETPAWRAKRGLG